MGDEVVRTEIRNRRIAPGRWSVITAGSGARDAVALGASVDRLILSIAVGIAALILVWLVLAMVSGPVPFAVLSRETSSGVESAAAFARLFGALVLVLVPDERGGRRLRWVAVGMVVLGIGGLVFGALQSVLGTSWDLNALSYESLLVRTIASAFFVVGLVPPHPPAFTRRVALVATVFGLPLAAVVTVFLHSLPRLVQPISLSAAARSSGPLPGLTGWHWVVSSITLILTLAVVWGAYRCFREQTVGGWVLLAMVVFAGSHVHNIPWPSSYSSLLTTGDLLRFLFAAAVLMGGILELRFLAAERARLLAVEQAQSRRLTQLAQIKEELTRMVIHEFSAPVAAIRGFSAMLATGALTSRERDEALATIKTQTDILARLVHDVGTAATMESGVFNLQLVPTPLRLLLIDISAYARTRPDIQLTIIAEDPDQLVWADQIRVAQVLSNLLDNVAKYCPPGTHVHLRAVPDSERVHIEVTDNGPGIDPEDAIRIFEKFARGRHYSDQPIPGLGMGLFISQQIVIAHRSRLRLRSELGSGSTFSFDLRVVR